MTKQGNNMERDGLVRIRAEVLLILTQRFSLSKEEVISELSILINEQIKKQHPAFRFNERQWNVRRYKSYFRDYGIFISVSTHKTGVICVRISIPKNSGDCIFEIDSITNKANEYARLQLEKILE
jgi:hypothetical protein